MIHGNLRRQSPRGMTVRDSSVPSKATFTTARTDKTKSDDAENGDARS